MLGRLFSLRQSFEEQTSQGDREYFDIGLPMSEPLSPAGTIAIVLERSFLHRNEVAFLWASVPDNGGVKYGFLPYVQKDHYKSIRLSYLQFSEILEQLDLLPERCVVDVLAKKKSERFCAAIRGLVIDTVVDGMLAQPMQAARRIEFCLDRKLTVLDSDIRYVFVPNTYKEILSRDAAKIEPSKVVYYNPKYSVMDCLEKYEVGCHWRI
tara:strand:- start:98 stop:724 length:627 start_codon:yes stop_codon:yes gene_type:complete